ncbi:hypothetical protein ACFXKD_27750 [Nocardiopsis aegyptia]|uniref:hypothetical protein n=1 Tax=Nocardiopsis aegyptia TaxID=220378 RepID=UPI00366BD250
MVNGQRTTGRQCEHAPCGERIVDGGGGRIPRFCSSRCRVAAHRARRAIPAEMRERRRWVRRDEEKVPLMARSGRRASPTAPGTWAKYDVATKSTHGVGLGYVLRQGDGLVCVDLDHCLWGDRVSDWAQRILDATPDTFVERSASGTGLHIWGHGEMTKGRRIRRDDGTAVEVYGTGRYIAMGERWRGSPLELADLTPLIQELTK